MSDGCFQTVDLTAARAALERLFEQVLRGTGRVEITRDGTDDACVLISQEELESLEKALEILSSSESGAEMRREVLRIADDVSPRTKTVLTSGAA